jgi:nitrogenase-associated protein
MASIIFYEKPGCANNTRQKKLLESAGHELISRNLLSEAWTVESLRTFFAELPVREWFNHAAPRVKSGDVVPEQLDAAAALALMQADPLLIRRPLMECEGRRIAGFDAARVEAWLGSPLTAEDDIQTCHRNPATPPCPDKDHLPLPREIRRETKIDHPPPPEGEGTNTIDSMIVLKTRIESHLP